VKIGVSKMCKLKGHFCHSFSSTDHTLLIKKK
jgi:hypothetical protein